MSNIDENEFVIYKKVAQNIIDKIDPILKKINKCCEKLIVKYNLYRQSFFSCKDIESLQKNSAFVKKFHDTINALLSVQDRLAVIEYRNKERIEILDEKLKSQGIYNENVDKKIINQIIKDNINNVSETTLNLNQNAKFEPKYVLFNGVVLVFYGYRINFSNEINSEVLKTASSELIGKIIETFPHSVSTIPEELLLNSELKNKILKQVIIYVAQNSNNKSISQINKSLGGLLVNCEKLNLNEYSQELKNLFNVEVKLYLKNFLPEQADEIESKLKCNENSPYLPSNKRSNSSDKNKTQDVSDNKLDEKQSEENSTKQDESNQILNEIDNLLDDLFEENESEQDENENKVSVEASQTENSDDETIEDEFQNILNEVIAEINSEEENQEIADETNQTETVVDETTEKEFENVLKEISNENSTKEESDLVVSENLIDELVKLINNDDKKGEDEE